jgi:Protein of unknown function (DUF3306)
MSDPENFLSRWSRRKREVRVTDTGASLRRDGAANSSPHPCGEGWGVGVEEWGTSVPRGHAPPPLPTRGEGEVVARPTPTPTDRAFDPASLPPIQSITAETDIRGFLGAGVPSELTRAALRRAWACDPAIRNFVGLADYDWDFNAADSMAGFGPLRATDDVTKMATHILEPNRTEPRPCNPLDPAPTIPKAEEATDKADIDAAHSAAAENHSHATDRDQPVNEVGAPAHADELTHREQELVAVQYTSTKPENRNALVRRQHGGALPK